ncbi:hypothetical protein Fcan01_10180 [Folsomia candida]|uniref:Uncharacterized protein n=1 Tax=Folsomia candida TaxID=158441 RepID=A0A226E804_FOLCA|nr:hypothetical protein Fcan01_10180 [Folsomia candida]
MFMLNSQYESMGSYLRKVMGNPSPFPNTVSHWALPNGNSGNELHGIYPILMELRPELTTRHEAIEEVRQPGNIMREYSCLNLINMEVMETMGLLLLYIHSTYGQFCLFCNFVSIKKWDSLTYFTKVMLISWSVNGQLVWGLILETFGRMDMEAKKVPKSWKLIKSGEKIERKILSKFRKSMRPLTFGEEGVFTMKRMTVLKFFRGIIKGTFRALLTIGQ